MNPAPTARYRPAAASVCLLAALLIACARPAAPSPAPPAAPAPGAPAAAPAPAAPAAGPAPAADGYDERAVADFYRGKTIRILVGFGAGGVGYDGTARLVAQHLGSLIPGNPSVIVENRPGAGSMVAANYVANVAPKDGTTIGMTHQSLILSQAIGVAGLEYDARTTQWLSSSTADMAVCVARADGGVRSISESMAGKEVIIGASGRGAGDYDRPKVLRGVLGANLKLIPGYDSNAKIQLAMESNEVQGQCTTLDFMRQSRPDWMDGPNPFVNVIVTLGRRRDDPAVANAPAAEALARTPHESRILEAFSILDDAQQPFHFAAGVPADRVAAVRAAFVKLWQLPDAQQNAERMSIKPRPQTGDQFAEIVRGVLDTPPEVIADLKRILESD